MGTRYPAVFETEQGAGRLDGELDFTDPTRQPSSAALRSYYPAAMPAGLGWDSVHYPFAITSIGDILGGNRSVATLTVSAKSLFDAASTARSAPANTFYVNVGTGSDANNGLTPATAFKSIWKAVVAANAAGTPTLISVAAGLYYRANNAWFNGGAGVIAAVDTAFVATGGRVIVTTADSFAGSARDGTFTQCYTSAFASGQQVHDLANLDRFGNHTELVNVATPAICNATPNSWTINAGTLYVNRADQAAMTVANTRVYRPGTQNMPLTTEGNFYFGGATPGDGFDFEGCSDLGGAILGVVIAAPSANRHVLTCDDCSFRYAGGIANTVANCVGLNSWNGLAAFFNCLADAAYNDAFNVHNGHAAAQVNVLCVNCSGSNNGRNANASDNGFTLHDSNVVGVDICGYYEGNHGGTISNDGTSTAWLVRTTVKDDFGDLCFGGAQPPTAFMVNNTAQIWCDHTRILMDAAGYGYLAFAAGATINQHNVEPCGLPNSGAGVFTVY